MSVEDFLLMRPADFFLKLEYWRKAKNDEYKCNAAIARRMTITIVNMFAKHPVRDAEQFWPIGLEEKDEGLDMTAEERQESINELKKTLQWLKD